jgi:putative ABC transport system permease protein
MLRIALRSLVHEKGKFLAALWGVSFAAGLALAQTGLYVGFKAMATSVISRVGGDLWVMARGTQLLDFADNVSAGARAAVAAHPCVADARGVVFSWATIRKPSGGLDNVQLIGFEPRGEHAVPWSLAHALPSDLHAPMRVAVDTGDLARLEIPPSAIGSEIELNDRSAYVGAVTTGIKSFTVVPYLFAEARNAQRILGMHDNQFTYWALDLRDQGCAADVKRTIEARPDLEVHTMDEFREMTSDYWIVRSGAGMTLAFSAFLGLLVGAVVVGQTLFAMTEGRARELATLKAMGASNGELLSFVAWQALVLDVLGGGFGVLLAMAMQRGVAIMGIVLLLTPGVIATGLACVTAMCALASLASVRKVLRLEPAAVFR